MFVNGSRKIFYMSLTHTSAFRLFFQAPTHGVNDCSFWIKFCSNFIYFIGEYSASMSKQTQKSFCFSLNYVHRLHIYSLPFWKSQSYRQRYIHFYVIYLPYESTFCALCKLKENPIFSLSDRQRSSHDCFSATAYESSRSPEEGVENLFYYILETIDSCLSIKQYSIFLSSCEKKSYFINSVNHREGIVPIPRVPMKLEGKCHTR